MKIAVASGKGGTGKTLISTNLFRTLELEKAELSLVDCDAEEPNVSQFITGNLKGVNPVMSNIPEIDEERCSFCGRCHEYCNYHAIVFLPTAGYTKVISELCHDCGACIIACPDNAIKLNERQLGLVTSFDSNDYSELIEGCISIGVYSPVPVIKEAIKSAIKETVILDSPPGISCPFVATTTRADYIILVTEPTPFGLNDLKLAAETLTRLNKKFGVIVNRAGLGNREVYQWFEENKIPLLLEIPFDREIARTYSQGKLITDELPGYRKAFSGLINKIISLNTL